MEAAERRCFVARVVRDVVLGVKRTHERYDFYEKHTDGMT